MIPIRIENCNDAPGDNTTFLLKDTESSPKNDCIGIKEMVGLATFYSVDYQTDFSLFSLVLQRYWVA